MMTKHKMNRSLMKDLNNMIIFNKKEMKEITGRGVCYEYYVEDGKIKQRIVYVPDK